MILTLPFSQWKEMEKNPEIEIRAVGFVDLRGYPAVWRDPGRQGGVNHLTREFKRQIKKTVLVYDKFNRL